jgi:hypothetical protein
MTRARFMASTYGAKLRRHETLAYYDFPDIH